MASGGGHYFWLGASADADPALVSDGAQEVSTLTGFDPLRCEGCAREITISIAAGFQFCSYQCARQTLTEREAEYKRIPLQFRLLNEAAILGGKWGPLE